MYAIDKLDKGSFCSKVNEGIRIFPSQEKRRFVSHLEVILQSHESIDQMANKWSVKPINTILIQANWLQIWRKDAWPIAKVVPQKVKDYR